MQTSPSVINRGNDKTITISFETEQDRRKGFATLLRSNIKFKGKGKNTFVINRAHRKLLDDKDIKFREI